jgi:hypothetical protein
MDMSKTILPSIPPGPAPALIRGAATPQPLGLAGLLGLALLICVPFFLNQAFSYHLAIFICINTIVVTSLSVLARAGQVSLCHGALAGVGAYASVLCAQGLGLPFLAGVVAAMAAAGGVAYLLGRIVLRLQGVYFVLVTFAFGELLRLVLLEFGEFTGGANGITNIPPASIAGHAFTDKAAFASAYWGSSAGSMLRRQAKRWMLWARIPPWPNRAALACGARSCSLLRWPAHSPAWGGRCWRTTWDTSRRSPSTCICRWRSSS